MNINEAQKVSIGDIVLSNYGPGRLLDFTKCYEAVVISHNEYKDIFILQFEKGGWVWDEHKTRQHPWGEHLEGQKNLWFVEAGNLISVISQLSKKELFSRDLLLYGKTIRHSKIIK